MYFCFYHFRPQMKTKKSNLKLFSHIKCCKWKQNNNNDNDNQLFSHLQVWQGGCHPLAFRIPLTVLTSTLCDLRPKFLLSAWLIDHSETSRPGENILTAPRLNLVMIKSSYRCPNCTAWPINYTRRKVICDLCWLLLVLLRGHLNHKPEFCSVLFMPNSGAQCLSHSWLTAGPLAIAKARFVLLHPSHVLPQMLHSAQYRTPTHTYLEMYTLLTCDVYVWLISSISGILKFQRGAHQGQANSEIQKYLYLYDSFYKPLQTSEIMEDTVLYASLLAAAATACWPSSEPQMWLLIVSQIYVCSSAVYILVWNKKLWTTYQIAKLSCWKCLNTWPCLYLSVALDRHVNFSIIDATTWSINRATEAAAWGSA